MFRTFSFLAAALLIPTSTGLRPPLAEAQEKSLPPEKAKAAFLKLLDRPKVPPNEAGEGDPVEKNGLVYSGWSFASEKKADGTIERVPGLTVAPAGKAGGSGKPAGGSPTKTDRTRPVMIVLHGTGGSKEGVQSWLEEFARRGVVGIAIDARYHGARSGGKKGSAAYVEAITRAWQTPAGKPMEHPFYYDTVWDLWRLIDLLEDKSATTPRRIGMVGISMLHPFVMARTCS